MKINKGILPQITIVLITILFFCNSCANMNKTKKGAIIGTTSGAVLGTVIGKAAGNTVLGAIIGAAVGGTVGIIIGKKMDKQAEEIKKTVPGAKVERVGEGIVIEFSEKILFDFNQSSLKGKSEKSMGKFVTVLKNYPDTDIEIQGHTDNVGVEVYNQNLSEERAKAVKTYLTTNNISGGRMTIKGMGENFPKIANDTKKHRAENRRVEFLITANQKMINDSKKEAGQ